MALINDFISEIKQGGLARTNRYIVRFTPPVEGDDAVKRKLTMFCDQVQLPGQNFSTTQNRTFGEFREMPYERLYDNISMSFLVDADMTVKRIFDKWTNKIADPITRTYGYYNKYVVDMVVEVQNTVEKTCYAVKLKECYPKTISSIQLDYASKDVMKLNVTFQYKYWVSDVVQTLPDNQVVTAETLNSYTRNFDAFQNKLTSYTLGDAQNAVTGKIADYEANWVSDNLPGLTRT